MVSDRARLGFVLRNMIDRCHNPKHKMFAYYGGRGITVCDDWRNSPQSFVKWALKNGYNKELTIERVDGNKSYSPENCAWVTRKAQIRNRRNTVKVLYYGEEYVLAELCEIKNLHKSSVECRIALGWTVENAIDTPGIGTWQNYVDKERRHLERKKELRRIKKEVFS